MMTTVFYKSSFRPLGLAFAAVLALPIVEFVVFFWVAGKIGLLPAILLLVATSFAGVALLRRQGASAATRVMNAMRQGNTVDALTREGLMVALGGILMILPGFVTDVIGLGLMLPSFLRSLGSSSEVVTTGGKRPPRDRSDRVIDLEDGEWQPVEPRRPPVNDAP